MTPATHALPEAGPAAVDGPVLILALPRSFTSIVCAMLGQHPQMYGFPELHLFAVEQMTEWISTAAHSTFSMEHGLLRAVAQLFFGEQTEKSVRRARVWLGRRQSFTTGMVFETLAREIHPRIAVEKGPSLVYRVEYMKRAYRMCPKARFLHVVRHPRTYCESVFQLVQEEGAGGEAPRWMMELLQYPSRQFVAADFARARPQDALQGWHDLNQNVCEFLSSVPASQQFFVRGEDLLSAPDEVLPKIAAWLGLRTDAEAVERMKHPEQSPYASFGPDGARNGFDPHFMRRPELRPASRTPEEPRDALQGLSGDVQALARRFGYR